MLKNRTKFIITFIVLLFGICLLNTNTVQAVEMTEEQLFDLIPNKLQLDIKEVEFEKADSIVAENIKNILKSNNIEFEDVGKSDYFGYDIILKNTTINGSDIKIEINASPINTIKEEFYKAFIWINPVNELYNSYTKNKVIDLTYNNHSNYNVTDETYVKNLKIESPRYYEVGTDFLKLDNDTMWNKFFEIADKYYNNLVNKKDIVIKSSAGAGGSDGGFSIGTDGTSIGIFKKGVLYEIRHMGAEETVPVITVSSSISDDEMNKYVIKILKECNKDVKEINSITQGATVSGNQWTKEVKDGYTVKGIHTYNGKQYEFTNPIIIRKEVAPVTKTDTTTNIKLEADTNVVPANTVLEVEPITEGQTYNTVKRVLINVAKMKVFDINLLSNGVKIQPNGKVKISIPIPTEFDTSKIAVYRITNNGEKIKYDVTVIDGMATFETDHFSTYVLAEEGEQATEVKQGEKDNTPKTGTETNILLYIAVCAIIGTIIIKRLAKE